MIDMIWIIIKKYIEESRGLRVCGIFVTDPRESYSIAQVSTIYLTHDGEEQR